jgi:Yip1 domain
MQLVSRATAILTTPYTEWSVIEREPTAPTALFINYVAILAAIPAIAGFIGKSLIGGYAPIGAGLLRALIFYLVAFAVVYVIAAVIAALAPRFGGEKSFANALKLSVYAHTPVWLAGIFLLIPGLHFLMLLGLYGVYLLWTGLLLLMRVPTYRVLPIAVIVAACAFVPAVVLAVM